MIRGSDNPALDAFLHASGTIDKARLIMEEDVAFDCIPEIIVEYPCPRQLMYIAFDGLNVIRRASAANPPSPNMMIPDQLSRGSIDSDNIKQAHQVEAESIDFILLAQ